MSNADWLKGRMKPQTPHPTERGKASNGTILVDDAKVEAWQTRWNKDFAHRWEEREGKLYPRETKP